MEEYAVDILPGEILQWVREDAARQTPQLWVRASKAYGSETDLASEAPRVGDEDDVSFVTASGLMEVSPQRGMDTWTLQIRAEQEIGLRSTGEDEAYEDDDDLPVDAFESHFLIPAHGEVDIVVVAEDADAWESFQAWLAHKRSAGPA